MRRKESEENLKVDPCEMAVWPILIIGAVLGTFLGFLIELNVFFCVCTGIFGSIIALCITYFVCEAIEEIQSMIKARNKKH